MKACFDVEKPQVNLKLKVKSMHRAQSCLLEITRKSPESTVIVSPSMSGQFAIPVVFSGRPVLSGWVPVAPVSISSHKLEEYQSLQLPVLAVYGENDNQFRSQVR